MNIYHHQHPRSTPEKLAILADAAKHDASCASSGGAQAALAERQGHWLQRRLRHLPRLHA